MDSKFEIGDLVWAKLKGFPAWPGKIIEPKSNVRKPSDIKHKNFVFFLGSENYAWIPNESIWPYLENKEQFTITKRVPKGFKEAVERMEEVVKTMPPPAPKPAVLPTVDDEVAQIFPSPPAAYKEHTRQSLSKPRREIVPAKKVAINKKEEVTHSRVLGQKKRSSSPAVSTPQQKKAKSAKTPASNHKAGSTASSDEASTPSKKSLEYGISQLKSKLEPTPPLELPIFPDYLPTYPAKNVIATPMKIGFLGLGVMGTGMVNNLLRSGHEVTVWNRTPSKCKDFVKEGALKAGSPSEVVQDCDITFSCISDPIALKDLVFGNCGVLQGISQGKAYVDLSTVDVETITDVHEAVTARGGRFVEAPVVGSRQQAEDGQLVILASGDRSLYEDCFSCFEAIGRKTFFLGEVGSASRMQLVVSLFQSTVMAGLAESLALADKVGLEQESLLQVLSLSSTNCHLLKHKGMAMVMSEFSNADHKLHLCQKDLRLAVNMSDLVDQPLIVGAAVNELFKKAKAKGYGEHDTAAIYRAADL